MKIWTKYLIVGWSIVTLGIIIISFELTKSNFTEVDYEVMMFVPGKEPAKITHEDSNKEEIIGDMIVYGDTITKKEFVDNLKKVKSVIINSKTKVNDPAAIYLFFPIYAFLVWAIPIIVFSLVGLLFSKKAKEK